MKGRWLCGFLVLLGCADTAPTEPPVGLVKLERQIDSLEKRAMIVQLENGRPDVFLAEQGITASRVYSHAIQGFAASLNLKQIEALSRNPNVKRISPDGVVSVSETWGLDRIDQRALPLDNSFSPDRTGRGVNAYIIDSGIRSTHSEFTGRIGNGVDLTGSGDTEDCLGHGTHVSATVGGTVYGVAKLVTLHPVRIFGCSGSTPTSIVLAGMDWVAQNVLRPAVVNMSLGGNFDQAMNDAVASLSSLGIVVVVAAGNSTDDACLYSPASAPSAITVGATEPTDERAIYSNYGACLDLFAPGSGITSAWYTADNATATLNGTSMASPHVAGVAALILSSGISPFSVDSVIKARSTKGVVLNARSTAFHLLYSGLDDDLSNPEVPPPPPPPAAPSDLWIENKGQTAGLPLGWSMIIVHWTDNSNNEESFEFSGTGVNASVYGFASANFPQMNVNLPEGPWTVQVRAINAGGESAWASISFCVPGPNYDASCNAVVVPPPDTVVVPPPPPPDTTTPPPPPCKPKGKSGKCH